MAESQALHNYPPPKNYVFGEECKNINEPQLNCEQCHDPHWFTWETQTKHLFNNGVFVSQSCSNLRCFFLSFLCCQHSGQYLAVFFFILTCLYSHPQRFLLFEFGAKRGLKPFNLKMKEKGFTTRALLEFVNVFRTGKPSFQNCISLIKNYDTNIILHVMWIAIYFCLLWQKKDKRMIVFQQWQKKNTHFNVCNVSE